MAAEAETGGEKTEEPSQKRLKDARERGQVPRSRELTNFATMIGGSATLIAIGGSLAARLSQIMRQGLNIDPQSLRNPDSVLAALGTACASAITVLLPIFGALIALVLLASVALGGWNFGGMGSWNDYSFEGEMNRRYEQLTQELFDRLCEALVAVANTTFKSN